MPPTRKIPVKRHQGERGTESKEKILELLAHEWDQVREKSNDEEEKQELIAHFNAVVAGSEIGDTLFGDTSTVDEFCELINGLEEGMQTEFVRAWNEAFEEV